MREFSETPPERSEQEETEEVEDEGADNDASLLEPFAGIEPMDPLTEFARYFYRPTHRNDESPPDGRRA